MTLLLSLRSSCHSTLPVELGVREVKVLNEIQKEPEPWTLVELVFVSFRSL